MPDSLIVLIVALLAGAAVGVERQWSGHASGPDARFAGVRTFTLLGVVGGIAGRMWVWQAPALAIGLLAIAGALVVAGYVVAARRDIDATTEVAALIVLAAGLAAGLGETGVASGVAAVTALLLHEKLRLHGLVGRLQGTELGAALRFLVMAAVILPLLPEGPLGSFGGGLRPRALWLLVLFFSGLSFLGYIAQRVIGVSRGHVVAGTLGGIVSSTSVTLVFARHSRETPDLAEPLARGAIAANTVLFGRVLVAATVLSPALGWALVPALVLPGLIGLIAAVSGARADPATDEGALPAPKNPLQLRAALEMAVLFQIVLMLVAVVGEAFGTRGVLGTAAVVGLTDADALTLSMARQVGDGALPLGVAARAVVVGLLSNTCVKIGLAVSAGIHTFRVRTVTVLAAMAAALAGALLLLPAA